VKTGKILLAAILGLGLVGLMLEPLLGFAPWQMRENLRVATGMGAKLACSGRYISGFDAARMVEDLATYSDANRLLDIHYDDAAQSVRAAMFGLYPSTARYRPGLGCTLEIGDTSQLDAIAVNLPPVAPGAWPTGDTTPAIEAASQAQLERVLAQDKAAGLDTRALVLVRGGVIVAAGYGAGITEQTPLLGWSMGKSLVAIMLGHLENRAMVTAQDANLFPAWEADQRAEISLQNLLQMSSGLDFDETYAPGSDATHMLFVADSAAEVALASPLIHEPGAHFSYSSGTTNLLSLLVHQHLGASAQASVDFLYQELLVPLGMRHTVLEPDPSGVFVGSSYIYASALDWARLGQLMLNEGELNGVNLLSPGWVRRASEPNSSANEPRYGYQFWLNGGGEALRWPDLPADAFAMMGNRQQVVMIIPSLDAVIVRLGWTQGEYPVSGNFSSLLQ